MGNWKITSFIRKIKEQELQKSCLILNEMMIPVSTMVDCIPERVNFQVKAHRNDLIQNIQINLSFKQDWKDFQSKTINF